MAKNLTATVQEQIKKATSASVMQYLGLTPEQRHEAEQQGQTLDTFIFRGILPVIQNTRVRKVLVIMEEGIGNMVMLTPALRMMRQANPRLDITVFCKETSGQVIKNWDVVDNVIHEFDYNFYDVAFLTLWSQNTLAQLGQNLQKYCKGIVQLPFTTRHEAIQDNQLFEFLDSFPKILEPHCDIATGTLKKEVDDKIKELSVKKFIVIADTTLRNFGWDKKRWPFYEELTSLIGKKFPEYKIFLVGDVYDKREADQKEWSDNVSLDFMGTINIPQLAYLISKAEKFIGNDTGPTHIAAAVGTETYAIWGPTLLSKNRPLGKNVNIITKNVHCSPCQYTPNWDSCQDHICLNTLSANDVYNTIFFPTPEQKKKILLVGTFGGGALRNETYIKKTLEKVYKCKVIPCDYRAYLNKWKNDIVNASYEVVNDALHNNPDLILICGGQTLTPEALLYINDFLPSTKLANWYVDNRGQVEEWFYNLSSICHDSYWSTGDPALLSHVFSQTQKMCEFLPIVPDETSYFPLDNVEKDIDVLFVGAPHSKERIDLLEYLVDNGVKISIFGDESGGQELQAKWSEKLKPFVKQGVYGNDFNDVLNRAKIVVNQNIINVVPLYFSDRYFYPMATKTVGLNFRVPSLDVMFEEGKHMECFSTPQECVEKINILLSDDEKRSFISEEGYKLFIEKYTLKDMLKVILENAELI